MWMDNFVLNLPKDSWPRFGKDHRPILFRFFESKAKVVVLSASNQADVEVHTDLCAQENVPILKRKGGGGCVVLGPGCLILTFAFYAQSIYENQRYFQKINSLWIESLESFGIQNLSQKGISDVCLGERKIVGTSIFRKKHLLVYQGSLLVKPDLDFISKLLKYPSRAPDYRGGRSHKEFMTSLENEGYKCDITELKDHCQTYFEAHVGKHFENLHSV